MRALALVQMSILALVSALLTAPASAQQSIAPPPTAAAATRADAEGLVWEVRPPLGDVATSFRVSDYRMNVQLRCRVASGSLVDCAPVVDTPQTFLDAAIRAASAARLAPMDQGGQPTDGREIVVRITFPIPVAVDPPPAPPSFPAITNPVWLERPTAEHFVLYYPPVARREGLSGEAAISCIVGAAGWLSCTVIRESPPGGGFGQAALRLSRHFRMAPETREGVPTEGGRVNIPIRFNVAE